MRYLKVIAQAITGNGKADTVLLRFYEQVGGGQPDFLHTQARAIDIDADGKVDVAEGDVTHNGRENSIDHRLLNIFAGNYLKMNWFNPAGSEARYMHVSVEDVHTDGSPDTVRLLLHEKLETAGPDTLATWHAAFDVDNDGTLESVVYGDANRDGVVGPVDRAIIQSLAHVFLTFNWR